MKYLPLSLLLVAFPAFAATSFNASGLVATVIELIIIGAVCGILILLVRKAPFVPAEWKEFIVYFIYFVAAIFLINWLLGLTGHSFITLR